MNSDECHNLAELVSPLRVVEINPQSDPRWESLITTLPGALVYHHPMWLQVLEETYGYKPLNLACQDTHGQLRGILPLFYARGLLSGRMFSSLPYTPMAGPLAYDYQTTTVLVRAAIERVSGEPGIPLELKMLSNELDELIDGVIGIPEIATYLLELPEHPELLRFGNSRSHASIKRAVNKATRLGVRVRQAETVRELWAWYELYLDTMRRLAALPRSYQFFKIAWERLQPRGLMQLLLAEHYEAGKIKLLGGLLLLLFGQTVYYAYGGWCREDQSLRPNDALHWQAIQYACANGFRYYDLGTASKNTQGLAEYKSKWGAQARWIYNYHYVSSHNLKIDSSKLSGHIRRLSNIHHPHALTRQFALAILQRSPIKVVACLSAWAHHHL